MSARTVALVVFAWLAALPARAQRFHPLPQGSPPANTLSVAVAAGALGIADRSSWDSPPWGVTEHRVGAYEVGYRRAFANVSFGVRLLGYHGRLHAIDQPSYLTFGGDVVDRFGVALVSFDLGYQHRFRGTEYSLSLGAIRMHGPYRSAEFVGLGSVRGWVGRLDRIALETKFGSRDALVTDRIVGSIGLRGDYGIVAFRAGVGAGYALGPGLRPNVSEDRRRSGYFVRSYGGNSFFYLGELAGYAEVAVNPTSVDRITLNANFGRQLPIVRLAYERSFQRSSRTGGALRLPPAP